MQKRQQIEYGDFQTPDELSQQVVTLLKCIGVQPTVILEPTCGFGSFVHASIDGFGNGASYYAFDMNSSYLEQLKQRVPSDLLQMTIRRQNFFEHNWKAFFANMASENILVIGNPPWVTNSTLGTLGSQNVPVKTNFQGYRGFDAKTGKANFDIAEWMLITLIESLQHNTACVAMLCKSATARKVLQYFWKKGAHVSQSSLHTIDAKAHFGVSVDACLFITHIENGTCSTDATIYSALNFTDNTARFGLSGKKLIADLDAYQHTKFIDGTAYYTWRSGVKHDASNVMEFTQHGSGFVNGFGDVVDLEPDYVFPLLKSSDIANNRLTPRKFIIITQHHVGEDTETLQYDAPKTWEYLMKHAAILDRRKSSIYRRRSRFAIFGIGDYSFAPWKVTISGLYKHIRFSAIGTISEKPIMVDDTCYFIPCFSQEEAVFVTTLLNSDVCQNFLRSLIFFDAKRPITKDILQRIDLKKLADYYHPEEHTSSYFSQAQVGLTGQTSLVFET